MSSKLVGALRGSVAKRYGKRAGEVEHVFGPGVHRTFPPAAYIYTFCLRFTRMVSMWVACMEWWRPVVQLLSTGVPRAISRREVQRSISPRLKDITVYALKLENSGMLRVKGQVGCRICDPFYALLSLVSWHLSARELTARSPEGAMRCTVSCIASQAPLCSALDSGQRWDLLLHAWQKKVSARGARRLQRTSCTACGPAGRTSSTDYS